MDTQPLDPRLNATVISELGDLATQEVALQIPKLTRADADSLVVSSENVIVEEMDYANAPMTAAFCVGDCVLKINEEAPQSAADFKKIMVDLSPCTVTVSRRSFVVAPGEPRLRTSLINMGLPYQRGFTYQVVCCKKQAWDRFISASFGFLAEDVHVAQVNANKFIIAEISTNTAAEKYFAVGDALIDFRTTPLKPKADPNALKQFNITFQAGTEMEVLVERPVTRDARVLTEGYIRRHLLKHNTPAMSDDAINIGINAAFYHRMLWRKMTAVGILQRPPPPPVPGADPVPTRDSRQRKKEKKKKVGRSLRKLSRRLMQGSNKADEVRTSPQRTRSKQRKSLKAADVTAVEKTDTDFEDTGKHISLDTKKSFQEISTDVSADTELETVGYRYSSEGEDDDEFGDDEKEKIPAAKPIPKRVVVPVVRPLEKNGPGPGAPGYGQKKSSSRKFKLGLFSSLAARLKKS